MTYGTCYFRSMIDAVRYYCDYEPGYSWREVAFLVEEKVRNGDIHIGMPPLKDGETCFLIDKGTRWAVDTHK